MGTSNAIIGAVRYAPDFPGLAVEVKDGIRYGKLMQSEQDLEENRKGKETDEEEAKQDDAVVSRLAQLGY